MHLKTMAEMLRRAAEHIFETELREEDEIGLGMFPESAKEEAFGSKRIFDGKREVMREYLQHHMLDYGIRLRWYVEGSTEVGALETILEAYASGIQIINLGGEVAARGGRGLRFRESLRADEAERIFSFILLDADRPDNVRLVRRAASDDDFCGQFFLPTPDFEKENFVDEELKEIIWEVAVEQGASEEQRLTLHDATAGAPSTEELIVSARAALPQLAHLSKGEDWGRRLGEYAWQNSTFENGIQRPIVSAIVSALRATHSDFRLTRQLMKTDPDTGQFVERTQEDNQ